LEVTIPAEFNQVDDELVSDFRSALVSDRKARAQLARVFQILRSYS